MYVTVQFHDEGPEDIRLVLQEDGAVLFVHAHRKGELVLTMALPKGVLKDALKFLKVIE